MEKIYVSMADFSAPLCDDDGHTIEGKQSVVETGTLWVKTDNDVIGGEVHLEEIGAPWHWLEITKEHFEMYFREET